VAFGVDWRVATVAGLALLPLLGGHIENEALAPVSHAGEAIKSIAVTMDGQLLMRPLFRWIARSNTPEILTATAPDIGVDPCGLIDPMNLTALRLG
jgi:glutathione-regulated potassium-efflux system ancillary protein KefC